MMEFEMCKAILLKDSDLVVVRRESGDYIKIKFRGSLFYQNSIIYNTMNGRWIEINIMFNGEFISKIKYYNITVNDYVDVMKMQSVIPRSRIMFKSVDNVDDLFNDDKISTRLACIYTSYDSIAANYELEAMSILYKLINISDTSIVSRMQKLCLVGKQLPKSLIEYYCDDFPYDKCSPYLFFKVCEMALKYHLLTIDEFVYSQPCLPYTEFTILSTRKKQSISKLRNIRNDIKETVIEAKESYFN